MMNFDSISINDNVNPQIHTILNDAYREFVQTYGNKHSAHIKEILENISGNIHLKTRYYTGGIATTLPNFSEIQYTIRDDLSGMLKHELWHVYSKNGTSGSESLQNAPEHYLEQLKKNGILQTEYNKALEVIKSNFADEPDTLQDALFLFNINYFGKMIYTLSSEITELWTEWFNSQTHTNDTKHNFYDWTNGYFTYTQSIGSVYDCYTNILSMVSCLIPREKMLDAFLETATYKTGYSFHDFLHEFDTNFNNALTEQEKLQYGEYPFLKIIIDCKTIFRRSMDYKSKDKTRVILQDCTKTCFMAYLQKLENISQEPNIDIKQIYAEIKTLQQNMMWNTDTSKMENLEYIKVMHQIESTFKQILQNNLSIQNNIQHHEIQEMFDNIDFSTQNPFTKIKYGNRISRTMIDAEKEPLNQYFKIGKYHLKTGNSGIKGNLYRSLFALLDKEKYNLLFANMQNPNLSFVTNSNIIKNVQNNLLVYFYTQIETASTIEEYIDIYNEIYDLYIIKLENTLKTDRNIAHFFRNYSLEIIELQKNALFGVHNVGYMNALEEIINIYQAKANEYHSIIDIITTQENEEANNSSNSNTSSDKSENERHQNLPFEYKQTLTAQQQSISDQRKLQIIEYLTAVRSSIARAKIGRKTNLKSQSSKSKQDIR